MSQIFHRSANTIARVSIFGAVFFVAGLLGLFDASQPLAVGDRGARRARTADPVQPRAARRRQRHRLPLLPHLGRGFLVRRHSADQDVHELPLADLFEQPVSRAGARELPLRTARFSGRACTICRTSSTSTTASTCTKASAARRATARSIACRSCGRKQSLQMEWCLDCHRNPERYVRPRDAVFSVDYVPPANQLELGDAAWSPNIRFRSSRAARRATDDEDRYARRPSGARSTSRPTTRRFASGCTTSSRPRSKRSPTRWRAGRFSS